jgi:hypothetical protein
MILIADLPGNLVDRPRRKLKCLARLGYAALLFSDGMRKEETELRIGVGAEIPKITGLQVQWHLSIATNFYDLRTPILVVPSVVPTFYLVMPPTTGLEGNTLRRTRVKCVAGVTFEGVRDSYL